MVGKRIKSKKCPFLLAFISFCCIFVPYLKRTAMAKKEKINKTDIVNVLEHLSEQELRVFVKKQLAKNGDLKAAFTKEFQKYFIKKASADTYIGQVIDAFIEADEDYGYITFKNAAHLSSEIYEVMEAAQAFRRNQNYEADIDICFTVLENGIEAVNHNDDSYGYLGDIMDSAFEELDALVKCSLDEDSRLSFFDYCCEYIEDETFDGWDWHCKLYRYLVALARDEEEYEQVSAMLDKDKNLQKDGFLRSSMMKIKCDLLHKWKGESAVREFESSNLNFREFREKAIQEAMDKRDFQQAYHLALDGIKQDEASGTVVWRAWLLRVAQAENSKEQIVKYATVLFFCDSNFSKCYDILKENVSDGEWDAFVQNLTEQAETDDKGELYAFLCVKEQWIDKLFAYVKKGNHIRDFVKYEPQLRATYADAYIERYIMHVYWIMEHAHERNRATYQEMCGYLKDVCRFGGTERAKEVAADLRAKYKRYRALMEELGNVGL